MRTTKFREIALNNCITLTDAHRGEWVESCDQQMGPFRLIKQTLQGGLSSGVDILEVHWGDSRIRICPTRGMSILDVGVGKKSDSEPNQFGWDSPVRGPVHPSFVEVAEPSGLGWLDGFDEMFVRCGLTSNGAPELDDRGLLVHPLHGRIGNLPASVVQVSYAEDEDQLVIIGTIIESRFHFGKWKLEVEYRLDANSTSVQVVDRVTNFGGTPNTFQLLYHCNFGRKLLEPDGTIAVASKRVIPRNEHSANHIADWSKVEPPQAGYAETVYFFEPKHNDSGQSLAILANASQSQAVGVRYSPEQLPCFSLWKNFAAREDGYVVGLEPATNYPNTRSFEEQHDRVVSVEPGETKTMELELIFAETSEKTKSLLDECNAMQADVPAELNDQPDKDFCE
jgi:galactose mutarotase-like enzyme